MQFYLTNSTNLKSSLVGDEDKKNKTSGTSLVPRFVDSLVVLLADLSIKMNLHLMCHVSDSITSYQCSYQVCSALVTLIVILLFVHKGAANISSFDALASD